MKKNKTLLKYTLPNKLLDLLDVKLEEITDYKLRFIYFTRGNRKLMIKIDSNYYSNEDTDTISLSLYDTSYGMRMEYGLEIFTVVNITCDSDFEKFRKMLALELYQPIKINCNENTE